MDKTSNLYTKFKDSKLRYTIWPIRSFELFKFTPMAILMFSILLNQNIVRSLKDSLVMTQVGAEVINFIKLWGEMPIGVLFVIIYSKLCDKFSPERAFRIIVTFFLCFYTVFAFVLYPNKDLFHPDPIQVQNLIELYPHFKWFIVMWGQWSFILMYIMGELWPIIIFSLLFWQLANKITKIDEASRFYPFFTIFGQANCLIAGSVIIYFSSPNHILYSLFAHLSDKTEIMVKSLTVVILISGIICIFIQRHIDKTIIQQNKHNKELKKIDKQQINLGLVDSFKLVIKSPYLLMISLMLISYSFSINLIEGTWMFKAREMFPKAENFIAYQGRVLFWIGVTTIFCAMIGSHLIKIFGWVSAAILTPIMMFVTGTMFFLAVIINKKMDNFEFMGYEITPLLIIVIIGALQSIFSKGLKYSLYDATKEMAYIPLDEKSKTKGKAAADIVGAKIGKSAGAIIQISIFTIFPTITYNDIAGLLMTIFILICIVWIYAVLNLSKQYNKKISDM